MFARQVTASAGRVSDLSLEADGELAAMCPHGCPASLVENADSMLFLPRFGPLNRHACL